MEEANLTPSFFIKESTNEKGHHVATNVSGTTCSASLALYSATSSAYACISSRIARRSTHEHPPQNNQSVQSSFVSHCSVASSIPFPQTPHDFQINVSYVRLSVSHESVATDSIV